MIKCLTCGTNNLEGSQYCDECGKLLNSANTSEVSENKAAASEKSVFQSASVTSVGIPLIFEEPKTVKQTDLEVSSNENGLNKDVRARLIIERGSSIGTEFQIFSDESNIGRWDADNGIFPDVDLDTHDPEAKVSRRHARIIYENDKFLIEDLGSTNGTFVNRGRRLLPGTPHILTDGDEIIVGKTFLRFNTL